jgi:plasmid stabilization system protein ParE
VIGYRLLPPAEEEMTEAALYYDAARSGFGDAFLDDIRHAIDTIRERPHLGVAIAYGFRRALLRRFPFSLIYAVGAEEIIVVAVAHQRRSPNYWRARV